VEFRAPDYTGSIDVAITLLPDGFYWILGHGKVGESEPLGGAYVFEPNSGNTPIATAEASTAALALCAAALRARALPVK
jgi:hypothetical protein